MKYLAWILLVIVGPTCCFSQTKDKYGLEEFRVDAMAEIKFGKLSRVSLVHKLSQLVGSEDAALKLTALFEFYKAFYLDNLDENMAEIGLELTGEQGNLVAEEAALELLASKLINPSKPDEVTVPDGIFLIESTATNSAGLHYFDAGAKTNADDVAYVRLGSSLSLVIFRSLPNNADVICTKAGEQPKKLMRPTNMQVYLAAGKYSVQFQLDGQSAHESIEVEPGKITKVECRLKK